MRHSEGQKERKRRGTFFAVVQTTYLHLPPCHYTRTYNSGGCMNFALLKVLKRAFHSIRLLSILTSPRVKRTLSNVKTDLIRGYHLKMWTLSSRILRRLRGFFPLSSDLNRAAKFLLRLTLFGVGSGMMAFRAISSSCGQKME